MPQVWGQIRCVELAMLDKAIQKAGIAAAVQTAANADRPNGLRASLVELAQRVGIDRIEEQDIPTTALLLQRPDKRYTLFLKKGRAIVRQRFSIAHEISHVLLQPCLRGNLQIWTRHDPTMDDTGKQVEYLCDQMAAEILMPESLFSSWMNSQSWTAFALPEASNEFSVSLETAARRFVEMRPGRSVFARWSMNNRGVANFTKAPIAPHVKNLRALEFVTEGRQPSGKMQTTYKSGKQATTTEVVRLVVGRTIQSKQCVVESICHGNGQWREVYSFVYPKRTSPGQDALDSSLRSE